MSDGISRMYDDYDDYLWLCTQMGVKPLNGPYGGEWMKHESELQIQRDPKPREAHILGEN